MNKTINLLISFFLLTATMVIATPKVSAGTKENYWESKAAMPTARYALGVAVVDGKIYAIGGYNSSLELVGNNEMYNPLSDTWATLAAMPTPRARFGIAVCQNKIYVIGGIIGTVPHFQDNALGINVVTGINEVYDTETNTWETKTPMPTERGVMQANTVDGKIYVTGGFAQNQVLNVTEVYDPSIDSWSTLAPMPVSQEEFASTTVDQKIFIVSDKVQIFNTKADHWSIGVSPPTSVYQGAAVATTGSMALKRIYVIHGGLNFNQIYDPDIDNWTLGAPMPNLQQNRLNLAVAVVNDKIYAIGGSNTNDSGAINILATNDLYTPLGYGTLPESTSYQQTTSFPTLQIAALSTAIGIALVGIAVYFKKRKHQE